MHAGHAGAVQADNIEDGVGDDGRSRLPLRLRDSPPLSRESTRTTLSASNFQVDRREKHGYQRERKRLSRRCRQARRRQIIRQQHPGQRPGLRQVIEDNCGSDRQRQADHCRPSAHRQSRSAKAKVPDRCSSTCSEFNQHESDGQRARDQEPNGFQHPARAYKLSFIPAHKKRAGRAGPCLQLQTRKPQPAALSDSSLTDDSSASGRPPPTSMKLRRSAPSIFLRREA